MKVSDLISDKRNARKATKRGNAVIRHSLQEFGAGRSILIDREGRVIAGNKTAANAAAAGIEDVIVVPTDGTRIIAVQRTDLDLEQDPKAKALAIADNRTAEFAEWDPANLKDISDEIDLKPFFTDAELADLLPDESRVEASDDDAPEPPVEPKTKLGDLYLLGEHRLLCGDATDAANLDLLLDGAKIDFIFTDPPYGIAVQMNQSDTVCKETILGDETTDVAVAAYHLCAALDVPMILWGANHYAADARLPNAKCWLCWDKQEANNHLDQADCEYAWTNIDSPARIFHHLWAGFRRDSEQGERRVHPTQKPVALIEEILNHFGAGKVILDLFGGSGSTLIACERTRRKALLMELDPKYCDVIVARWEKVTGREAQLIQAGEVCARA